MCRRKINVWSSGYGTLYSGGWFIKTYLFYFDMKLKRKNVQALH